MFRPAVLGMKFVARGGREEMRKSLVVCYHQHRVIRYNVEDEVQKRHESWKLEAWMKRSFEFRVRAQAGMTWGEWLEGAFPIRQEATRLGAARQPRPRLSLYNSDDSHTKKMHPSPE